MNIFQRIWNTITGRGDNERKVDDFPPSIANDCHAAREQAIRWYRIRYKQEPRVPKVKVWLDEYPHSGGMGGWCANSSNIHIWKGQRPFLGSLIHEFARTLCFANNRPQSEVVGI